MTAMSQEAHSSPLIMFSLRVLLECRAIGGDGGDGGGGGGVSSVVLVYQLGVVSLLGSAWPASGRQYQVTGHLEHRGSRGEQSFHHYQDSLKFTMVQTLH